MKTGVKAVSIVIISMLAFLPTFFTCNKTIKNVEQIERVKSDTLIIFMDKDSILHYQKEIEIGSLREQLALNKKLLNDASKGIGIKNKQIDELLAIKGKVRDSIVFVGKNDTGSGFIHNFIRPDSFSLFDITLDSLFRLKYEIDVPLTIIDYWGKKHKFLWFIRKRKTEWTDISSKNKNITFTEINKIKIER